jgi:catalase
MHQITITMSDRGIPASYRNMHGFGSHTFSFYNSNNERFWVKFHFRTEQGIKNMTDQEAAQITGQTRDSHQIDLFDAVARGDFPRWTMFIQVMTEQQAMNHHENPFDVTKVWFHGQYPLIEVGYFELNRNPENYFAEVEQAAFDPSHVIPGIGFSPDKLLQGRLFSYGDAQRYRLGVNSTQIPVNMPHVPVHSYHRDGTMRVDGNYTDTVTYQPNSQDEWSQANQKYTEPPLTTYGDAYHYEPKADVTDDCFYQPGKLYNLMTEAQKQALVNNTNAAMCANNISVSENIRYRHAAHCYLCDADYGIRIAQVMNLDINRIIDLSKLSHEDLMNATR